MLIEAGIASARAGDARSMVDDDGLEKLPCRSEPVKATHERKW